MLDFAILPQRQSLQRTGHELPPKDYSSHPPHTVCVFINEPLVKSQDPERDMLKPKMYRADHY